MSGQQDLIDKLTQENKVLNAHIGNLLHENTMLKVRLYNKSVFDRNGQPMPDWPLWATISLISIVALIVMRIYSIP